MSRIAQPAHHARQQPLGNAGERNVAPFVLAHRDDHDDEEESACHERATRAEPRGDRACERRTDGARDVERHGTQRHGARKLRTGHQLVDARLLRRQIKREARADDERQQQQQSRADHARERRNAQEQRGS